MSSCTFFRIGKHIVNANYIKYIKFNSDPHPTEKFKSGWMGHITIYFHEQLDIEDLRFYCKWTEFDQILWRWENKDHNFFYVPSMTYEEALKEDEKMYQEYLKEIQSMMEE